MPWTDSHSHLDFSSSPHADWAEARAAGVGRLVVPAVEPEHYTRVVALAEACEGVYFALGIHPCSVERLNDIALQRLKDALVAYRSHPKLVAVGEIGLDHFLPKLPRPAMQSLFEAQLRLARDTDLPVILHVRKAQDAVLAALRRFGIRRGIAHAFNGSSQQMAAYVKQGLALGFGGAATFSRAHNLHRLLREAPAEHLVIETDSPDIAPAWLPKGSQNSPVQIPRIAEHLAELRGVDVAHFMHSTESAVDRALSLPHNRQPS